MGAGFREWAVIQRFYRDNDVLFRLMKDLQYKSMDGATYIVPQGFVSDLGSIPKSLWGWVPPHEFPSAFVLHDYLCKASWISRRDADKILQEALRLSHALRWKVRVIYWGVRSWAFVRRLK